MSQQRTGIKRWFLCQNDPLNMTIIATPTMACNDDTNDDYNF